MNTNYQNENATGTEAQTERAFRASELNYRRLFEAARDGIMILELDSGRITDVNPFLVQLLGFSRSEMIGQTVGDLSPFKDIEKNMVMLERLQKDGYVRYDDLPLETRDGRKAAVEFVSNVYQVGDKKVIQCNIRDITARKRAELVSKQLAAIVESSPDAIIGKSPDGIITSWNRGAEKIFGYTSSEMLGTSIDPLLPADRLEEENQILEKIAQGESVTQFETLRQTKDGRLIDVSLTASPIRDAAGKIIGVSKVASDISERKRAEVALRESEQRFRTMANSILQLAWIARADGYIVWYNRRWYDYTGTTPEQMEGWGWQSVHDPEVLPAVMEKWKAAIVTGKRFEMEFPLRGADGRFHRFLTCVQPLKDSEGRVVQWFGTNTDVEVLKQAQESVGQLNVELEQRVRERTGQLQAANEELEAFSYSVSHDLRAPLRHVLGFVKLLEQDAGSELSEKKLHYLAVISQATKRMGNLIDDLLTFSRVGRVEMQKANVNLDELVREVVDEFQAETQDRKIVWQFQPLPSVRADRALLRLVLVNLISNAVKFTGKCAAARIEIGEGKDERPVSSVERQTAPPSTVIYIRDNGVGFDPEYAGKLFGVFQRLHSHEEFEGTGIGLANVQRIIQRHGGRVWAEGAVAGGATFYFSIPNHPNGGNHAN